MISSVKVDIIYNTLIITKAAIILKSENKISVKSLHELLIQRAQERGSAPFLHFLEKMYTYRQISGLVHELSEKITRKYDINNKFTGLICGNSPDFIVAYFAILSSGGKVVPINPRLVKAEIKHIIMDTGMKFVIHPPDINIDLPGNSSDLISKDGIDLCITDTGMTGDSNKILFPENIDDVAVCIYTSGTTGRPKGALLTHQAIMHNARMCTIGLESKKNIECFVAVLPFFHAFSISACLVHAIWSGGKLLIVDKFQPLEILRQMVKHKATVFLGVPAMYGVMASIDTAPELPELRLCVSGGAPLPKAIFNAFYNKYGIKICEGDGPTECGPATSINPVGGVIKVGSIGLPLCDVEMKIVDDNGDLPHGEVGEIIVKCPSNFSGYLNQPDETAKTLRNGWVYTGDLGFKDEDGYFTIVGRKKDMLIVGGLNVYPSEIEEQLRMHPLVADVAVVGKDCGVRGEIPVAFVQKNNDDELTIAELKSFLKDKIANYKIPRELNILDALPRNATGKVQKNILRKLINNEMKNE